MVRVEVVDAGSVVQVVCIVKTQSTTLFLKLIWSEAFEGSLRGYRHEDGEGHRPVGQMKRSCARLRDLKLSDVVPPEGNLI
jgi:hypothetical protein